MYGPPPRFNYDKPPKPQGFKDLPRYLKATVGGFFARYVYIFKLVWETSPLILFTMCFTAIFNGIFPVLGAYISAELINELVIVYTTAKTLFSSVQGWDLAKAIIDETNIDLWILLEFGYLILNGIINTFYNTIISISGEKVSNHIKVKIITKAKDIDLSQFDLPQFYEKYENACREASFRPIEILNATFTMISSFISCISFIVVLTILNSWIPLLIIIFAAPAAIVKFIYGRKNYYYIKRHSKERRHMEYFSRIMTDKDLVKEVKLFDLSDTFIGKFKSTFAVYFKGLKNLVVRENTWQLVITIISAMINSVLFFYIATQVATGNANVGDFSLYVNALKSVISSVGTIVSATATIYQGTLFIDNMIEFSNVRAQIIPNIPEPLKINRNQEHEIVFDHVSFHYPGTQKDVIKDMSFQIRGGSTTVLVGLNGAGKTTLIKLLTRLYDPTEGVIYLDGKDIRNYDVKDLYSIFGIIFQDFGKYAVSANENIYYGDIQKGYSEKDVLFAAKQSGANEFIEKLPKAYNTPLMKYFEDDGVDLSIGQWQKLSVSRAFYANSDIVILDEPTASLDAIAEQQIFNQFDELRKNKTTIFVSHRLSSATTADTILVIENGCLVEQGSHEELMKEKGKYYELFTTQAKRYQYEK